MALRLTDQDVRRVLDVTALVEAMEAALVQYSRGEVVQPVRTVFDFGDGRLFGTMPAYIQTPPLHGAKMLTVIPSRGRAGLPTHAATIVLLNPASGELAALVEGNYLTEMRTAAVSAVSVRHLAADTNGTFAILGSGAQARSHAAVFSEVFRFRQTRAWSPNRDHLASFINQCKRPVQAVSSAEAAVREADVVLLATSSPTPVINFEWIKPGAHVVSLGACRPNQREMDPELVASAYLVVDSREAAIREAGDIVQGINESRFSEDHIKAELGEVSRHEERRLVPTSISVFKSLGLAVEDLVAASLAVQTARIRGIGLEL